MPIKSLLKIPSEYRYRRLLLPTPVSPSNAISMEKSVLPPPAEPLLVTLTIDAAPGRSLF